MLTAARASGDFLSESFVRRFGSTFAVYDEYHW